MSVEIKVDSREIFRGRVLHVTEDTVLLENGHETSREIIHHNGASAIVAFDEEGRLLMVRQFRYAIGRELLELPAGKIDPGETPEQCAARELAEETGYRAGKLVPLGVMHPAAAYTGEAVHIFLAEDISRGEQSLDDDEFLTVVRLELSEAAEMVMKGEITDSKTQIGILKINNIRQERI